MLDPAPGRDAAGGIGFAESWISSEIVALSCIGEHYFTYPKADVAVRRSKNLETMLSLVTNKCLLQVSDITPALQPSNS